MLVLGPIILIALFFYEWKFAKYPFIPARFVVNRTVLCAALIGFFDFVSFYLQFTYQYSFICESRAPRRLMGRVRLISTCSTDVVKDWSPVNQNYFGQTQTLALTFFAIMAGAIILYIRRYKKLLMIGLLIRLLGVGRELS